MSSFAFAYKVAGEFGSVPFFGSAGPGTLSQGLVYCYDTKSTVGIGFLIYVVYRLHHVN